MSPRLHMIWIGFKYPSASLIPVLPHKYVPARCMVLSLYLLFKHTNSFPTFWPLHLLFFPCGESSLRHRAFPCHLSKLTWVVFPEVASWQGHPVHPLWAGFCPLHSIILFLSFRWIISIFNNLKWLHRSLSLFPPQSTFILRIGMLCCLQLTLAVSRC